MLDTDAGNAGQNRRIPVHLVHGAVHTLALSPHAEAKAGERLGDAVQRMAAAQLSALPVLENGRVIGLLTEREVVAACLHGLGADLTVGQAMTGDITALHKMSDCRAALAAMVRANTRHLVLLEDDGRYAAILTERDLLLHGSLDFFPFVPEPAHLVERLPEGPLPRNATLAEVIATMARGDLGCVVIADAGQPVGVLSRRDIVALAAQDALDPGRLASEVMTTSPVVLPRSAPVAEIAQNMIDRSVRHVPLTRPDGVLDGVVTEHLLINLLGLSNIETLLHERSERAAADLAVRESLDAREAFYRALIDESVVSIAAVSVPDGRFVEFNDAACRNLGYTREEFATLRVADIEAVQTSDEVRAAISEMTRQGGAFFTSRHRRKNGDVRDVEISVHAVTMRGQPHLVSVWRDVTEQRRAEHSLRRAQEIARLGAWEIDLQTELITWSEVTYSIFGLGQGAPITFTDLVERIHPQDRDLVAKSWQAAVAGAPYEIDHRILVGTEVRWVHESGFVERDAEGRAIRGIGTVQDITERKAAQEQLEVSRTLLDAATDVIFMTNADRQIVTVNPAFVRLTGYTFEEARGRNPRFLKSGRHSRDFYREMWETIERTGQWSGVFVNRNKDGTLYHAHNTITTIRDSLGHVQYYACIARDVTEAQRIEEQLRFAAGHDLRTRLINRTSLLERLTALMQRDSSAAEPLALLALDIDRFRLVNDSFGYAAGDQVLLEIARRLTATAPANAQIARTEGDGFAVLLPGASQDAAWTQGQKLIAALAEPFRIDGREVVLSCSIGLALFPRDGAAPDILLASAEAAVAAAKTSPGGMTFFQSDMNKDAREHLDLMSALRGAAARRELLVFLQPQVRLSDGIPVGAEALLRWQHPTRGLLPPGRFIPLAEKNGLISDLTFHVFDEVCRLAAAQQAGPAPLPPICVNFSSIDFALPDLAPRLMQIVARHGITPAAVTLEVTETAAFSDLARTMDQIGRLADAGFSLAIDDFGTGYSNIAQLGRLPASWLKLDRSLLIAAERSAQDRAVLGAITALGVGLGKTVVMEGVETAAQRDLVADLGCHLGQGFLFARPMPAETFAAWWRSYRESGIRWT